MPNQPKPPAQGKQSDEGKMVVNLISHNQIERSLNEGLMCYILVAREFEPETETWVSEHIKTITGRIFRSYPERSTR